jgi:integrase
MTIQVARAGLSPMQGLIDMVLKSYRSASTRKVYAAHLQTFITSGHQLTRDAVMDYVAHIRDNQGKSPSTVNHAISALKALAAEAEVQGLLSRLELQGIQSVKSTRAKGQRSGNWLTLAGAQRLKGLPERHRLIGKRDAVIIGLLLGCGLRVDEVQRLTWRHYQEREGRMCLVDIVGKGGRIRTVPIPDWTRQDLNVWCDVIKSKGWYGPDEPVLKRARRRITGQTNIERAAPTCNGIWRIVQTYADKMGIPGLAPHDLRRTVARLMRKAGCEWEQIMFVLGHANIQTTMIYVGSVDLDEGTAAVDRIEWGPA